MPFVEAFEQSRLCKPSDDRLGAGEPHDPELAALDGGALLIERLHGMLDALGVRKHLQAELGQAVAAGMTLHQLAADLLFQFDESALHRGLARFQSLRGSQSAAVPRDGEEVAEVIPVEHLSDYALLP